MPCALLTLTKWSPRLVYNAGNKGQIMISRILTVTLSLIGVVTSSFIGYLEYNCRVNGEFCEQSLFSETPQTLNALLEQQKRLSETQDAISEKLEEMGADEGSYEPPVSEQMTEVLEELAAINERIDDVEAKITPVGTYGPIKLDYDYTADFDTRIAGSFEISLRGCQRRQANVSCSFIIKNTGAANNFTLNTGDDSIAYLPSGEGLFPSRIRMGTATSTGYVMRNFPPNIPAQGFMDFSNVAEDIPGFPKLKVSVKTDTGTTYLEFDNVRFVEAL